MSSDADKLEEGVPVVVTNNDDDLKSDAGSATTAPSVASGDSAPSKVTAQPKATTTTSRRKYCLACACVVLAITAVGVAVKVGTCNKNKDEEVIVTQSNKDISLGGDDEAPPMFDDVSGLPPPPFADAKLPLFDEGVLDTYTSRAQLEADLTVAAQDMVNKIILQNVHYRISGHHTDDMDLMDMEEIALGAGVSATTASAASVKESQSKIKKSLTNNQEKDVDESDYLKTDGTFIYAVYGDYLVVWDRQGNVITQEKMPSPEPLDAAPKQATDDFMNDMLYGMPAHAYIESMLLTENHVLVAVGGHGHFEDGGVGFGASGTHLRVYKKPTAAAPSLELVATRNLQGYFFDARYMEETNSLHIVTGGDFNTYALLVDPLEWHQFPGVNSTEYYVQARNKARTLIPEFVAKMADFLMVDGQLPTTLKVNSWLINPEQQQDIPKPSDHFFGSYDEAIRSYVLVTSISEADFSTESIDTSLPATTAAIIGPSSYSTMYATQDSVVLNVQRFDWNEETMSSSETLFLMHGLVSGDDARIQFHTVTSMLGYLPNPKAIDIQGTDLRLAVTHQKWTPMDTVWPVCGDNWYFEDECMTEDNWGDCFDVAINCREVIKTGCPYTFECAEEVVEEESSTENFVMVFDISESGIMKELGSVRIGEPHEVITGVHFSETFSYAMTFDQRDPFYVLQLEPGQGPAVKGMVKLDGFSSWLQPLNEEATLLVGIGQNVTGEGMDQAPSGVLVTVFDVTNPAKPVALASDMLVKNGDVDTFSDAEFDYKAIQYQDGIMVIPLSVYNKNLGGGWFDDDAALWDDDDAGFVGFETETVAPEEEDVANFTGFGESLVDFEGFVVLDLNSAVEQGSIKEVMRINHAVQTGFKCHYCNGYLMYRRSFLFEDKSLMTIHDSAVINTDLNTGDKLWSFNVTMPGEDMNCCN